MLAFALTILAGWAIIVLMLSLFEKNMIYFPTRYPDGFWRTEAVASGSGCTIEDHFFTATDGVRLHGWWCRPPERLSQELTAGMVLLLFHGNAGNLSHRADLLIDLATRLPAQVFIVDYRGYGRSEGSPSEEGLYLDGQAAWQYLTETQGVPPERIVIFGKSLGGAVAIDLATSVEPAGLIVQSAFTSVPDMAARHYPFVPRFLVRTRMESLAKIRDIGCRKLFVHGSRDEVVPFEHGRRLYAAAPEPKRFFEVTGARHNTTFLVGGSAYYDAVRDFVAWCGGSVS